VIEMIVPGALMKRLIILCDGINTLDEVVSNIKNDWNENTVRQLLEELENKRVLCDSRSVLNHFWETSENPPRFPNKASQKQVKELQAQAKERHVQNQSKNVHSVPQSSLTALIERRKSIRTFSGNPISFDSIIQMLWAAYGEVSELDTKTGNSRRTVPSAGALYPLLITVILYQQSGDVEPGIYRVWLGEANKVGLNLVSKDVTRTFRAFVDPSGLDKAHGIIIISGSFEECGMKYGNRSAPYVPIESGHAAQNVHLAAVESCVATVEVGGFYEQLLREYLDLPQNHQPLTSVVFGQDASIDSSSDSVDSVLEVNWVVPMAENYRLPFVMALARISDQGKREWSSGKAVSPHLAYVKAAAEAREWAACGSIPSDLIQASFAELESAIDPRVIVKFDPRQYRLKNFPFHPFDPRAAYSWVEGKNEADGSKAHVLADCIFFPYSPETPKYVHASSSGVAAHPDRDQAIESGVLELVERDAFMNANLLRLTRPTVAEETLPQGIRERIQHIRDQGFEVWIKDYSIDLAPVIFVLAQSKEKAYTTCASCSRFDVEQALDHALMEIEPSIKTCIEGGLPAKMKPQDLRMPLDHGALYAQRKYFQNADFLVQGGQTVALQDVGRNVAHSWFELLDRLKAKEWPLITVDLFLDEKLSGNNGLHIVRSIVPGMVPISFGYRVEPCGMERIQEIAKEVKGRPVQYRELTKFPHPFT